jgi:8-oxo-dGTP pyrophosphatase MutT (NUDIX family)
MSNFLRSGVDDALNKEKLRKTGFWGSCGAGFMVVCSSTGRFLLGQRSAIVPEPGTWGTWGGAVDSGEDPLQAAHRELVEETGVEVNVLTSDLYVYRKGEFTFYNYLAVVENEFTPSLSKETSQAGWFHLGDFPTPFHFGLIAILQDRRASQLLRDVSMSKFLARASTSVTGNAGDDTAILKSISLRLKDLGIPNGFVRVKGFGGTRVSLGFPPGTNPKALLKALKDIPLTLSGKPESRGGAVPFKDNYGNKYFVMLSPNVQWIVVDRSDNL